MQKKHHLKLLSLYGLDLKKALHAVLSVDQRKVKSVDQKAQRLDSVKDEGAINKGGRCESD